MLVFDVEATFSLTLYQALLLKLEVAWLEVPGFTSVACAAVAAQCLLQPHEHAGKTYRLEPVLEDPKSTQLFFVLRDPTSATTTYHACRFLYTVLPDHGLEQPGTLTLDFNKLENPPCAYTPYATCPLPPAGNRLPVALPVGEKRYHD